MSKKKEVIVIFGKEFPLYTDCLTCGTKDSCKFMTFGYAEMCPDCRGKLEKDNTVRFGGLDGGTAVTGFGVDQDTGKEVAVTASGKKIDIKETKFDLKNDPRGWKANGKKYREIDRHGLRNNR